MDDKTIIELIDKISTLKTEDSNRLTAIETILPIIKEDIQDLKVQKKEEPKEVRIKKNYRTEFLFKLISSIIAVMAFIMSLYNTFFKK